MSISEAVGSQAATGQRGQAIASQNRLRVDYLLHPTDPEAIALDSGEDVIAGLSQTPKSLPPRYFYDDQGSELFEQICDLPEYYLTRTETSILQDCAGAIAQLTGPCELVELGSGSAVKTRLLLDAYQRLNQPLRYLPIDISAGILESSAATLLADYPTLEIHGMVSTYDLALAHLEPAPLPTRMICFLGSTLGNLAPDECSTFFTQIKGALQPKEYFLLGIDLQKPRDILEAAYNDSRGVTAAFNLNMLRHLNQRFQGNFDLHQFQHQAIYNESRHQIEMHLQSLQAQTVDLTALNLQVDFAAEETILSEISRKFDLATMQETLANLSLAPLQIWTDPNQWFGLILCQLRAS